MRFLWQSQHIEYHAAYTKTNFPRVLHFSAFLLCMHAYTVRHCNCAEGLHFSAFIQEVKKKLYAYALDRMEICLHAKIGAMVSEIRVFKRR